MALEQLAIVADLFVIRCVQSALSPSRGPRSISMPRKRRTPYFPKSSWRRRWRASHPAPRPRLAHRWSSARRWTGPSSPCRTAGPTPSYFASGRMISSAGSEQLLAPACAKQKRPQTAPGYSSVQPMAAYCATVHTWSTFEGTSSRRRSSTGDACASDRSQSPHKCANPTARRTRRALRFPHHEPPARRTTATRKTMPRAKSRLKVVATLRESTSILRPTSTRTDARSADSRRNLTASSRPERRRRQGLPGGSTLMQFPRGLARDRRLAPGTVVHAAVEVPPGAHRLQRCAPGQPRCLPEARAASPSTAATAGARRRGVSWGRPYLQV